MKKLLAYILISLPLVAFSATMQSSNYQIETDSVNMGGTDNSTSTNYKMSDTVGEVGTGNSHSGNYYLYAGYRQMTGSFVSITSAEDVVMSPELNGALGGTSNGQVSWVTTTDSLSGYSLFVKASSNPALQSGDDYFSDYSTTSLPTLNFSINPTESLFGFTPEGDDIYELYKDDGIGGECWTGSFIYDTPDKCWFGFSTEDTIIAEKTTANSPGGSLTTLKVRAVVGSQHIQTPGTYTATIIATATAL